MLKRVFEEMSSETACQEAIWKWQARFMHRRQAPQEILQPNSAEEFGDDDAVMKDESQSSDSVQ